MWHATISIGIAKINSADLCSQEYKYNEDRVTK